MLFNIYFIHIYLLGKHSGLHIILSDAVYSRLYLGPDFPRLSVAEQDEHWPDVDKMESARVSFID